MVLQQQKQDKNLNLFAYKDDCYDVMQERTTNTFGKKLKEVRSGKGLSQKAIADGLRQYNIHIQPPAVTKWELGHSLPNIYQFFALCRLLEIEDGVRFFSGNLHPEENTLNEEGLKKVQSYREDLAASGLYKIVESEDPTKAE